MSMAKVRIRVHLKLMAEEAAARFRSGNTWRQKSIVAEGSEVGRRQTSSSVFLDSTWLSSSF